MNIFYIIFCWGLQKLNVIRNLNLILLMSRVYHLFLYIFRNHRLSCVNVSICDVTCCLMSWILEYCYVMCTGCHQKKNTEIGFYSLYLVKWQFRDDSSLANLKRVKAHKTLLLLMTSSTEPIYFASIRERPWRH